MALTACAGSTGSVKPVLSAPDSYLTQDCPRPLALPERDITQAEAEKFWRQDRYRLVFCAQIHKGLVDFIEDRDKRLSN